MPFVQHSYHSRTRDGRVQRPLLRTARSIVWILSLVVAAAMWCRADDSAQPSAQWWKPYRGADASGPTVLGFWNFDRKEPNWQADGSRHHHGTTARGAAWSSEGRFGGCLETGAAIGKGARPFLTKPHALLVANSPVLFPARAFSIEMWIQPKGEDAFPAELAPVLLDSKYVPTNHTGFMWSLSRALGGRRQMVVEIGLGDRSETWYSPPMVLEPGKWHHLAWRYDSRGTVTYYHNGSRIAQVHRDRAGPMANGSRLLAIGDRQGSLYRPFPGRIDEVRITAAPLDFRPLRITSRRPKIVEPRMAKGARLELEITNATGATLEGVTLTVELEGRQCARLTLPTLKPLQPYRIDVPIDTSLRPGAYAIGVSAILSDWPVSGESLVSRTSIPMTLVRRPLPHAFPVVMWGIGGVDSVVRELPRLKRIGFTHCLGLRVDYSRVWKEGPKALPEEPDDIVAARGMLDTAFENDLRIVASLSPGHWLRSAPVGKPFLRVDRNGQSYARPDISGLFPRVQQFCYDTGRALARAYGDHPAFAAALVHTETRGASELSFHPLEIEAYRKKTGREIPDEVRTKRGVHYRKLTGFPEDRVVADDDPILAFYRWFWQEGDGWNELHTRVAAGLHETIPDRRDFWTFYDPAVRVPSISGSGGGVDVLSHWTYTYPDPIRIGLCTDELFEMARVNRRGQQVMKMTQIIWYRSQTAPPGKRPATGDSPWVDRDPDAAYITIAPMHLREAFWWKMARPIQGIMYHGWQSLVPTQSKSAYRLTNPNTQAELTRLIHQIVQPLGPALRQVADPPLDVAFLESFTSQMFAGRGTYGWNHSWAGDAYHILMYARLQPRVLYEESLVAGGLEGVRLLVMTDCDVLPRSVVQAVRAFQKAGGLVVGDAELCPAIQPDYLIERYRRTGKAREDKKALQDRAAKLRRWLKDRYRWYVDSDDSDIVVRRRRFGSTDYIFAVNDRRTYGTYVGSYGLVMEDGLPSSGTITLQRPSGYVYSLTDHRQIAVSMSGEQLTYTCHLGPAEGTVWMVTERPIREVRVEAPSKADVGEAIEIGISVTDGDAPLDAVVPLSVEIVDPEGRTGEFTGYYGAAGGRLTIPFDFASNDRTGVWRIRVQELAAGRVGEAYIELRPRR